MQTRWGECAAVDAHIHFFSRRFFEVLASQAGKSVETVAAELGWELPPADPAVPAPAASSPMPWSTRWQIPRP